MRASSAGATKRLRSRTRKKPKKITAHLEKAQWTVATVEKRSGGASAAPPFTTSKLQQDASRKLRFSVKRAMMIAQRLYEGVELGEEGLGRADHLHAHRFGARFQRRAGRGARVDWQASLRQGVPARRSRTFTSRRRRRRRRTKPSVRRRRRAIRTTSSSICRKTNTSCTS